MPTSISHLGGRARVNEPGRYRKKNNKNLMAQGLPSFVGMPQPLRNLIAKRVKPSEAISKKKKTQSQLRTTNNLVPCSAVIEAAALTGQTYTKDFPDIDIYGDGELYKLTVTVKKGSFRWSQGNSSAYCDSQEGGAKWVGGFATGNLELAMNGTFATQMIAHYRVEFKFDKDLPTTTGSIFSIPLDANGVDSLAGISSGGFGMDPVAAGVPTTRSYFRSHLTGPEYDGESEKTDINKIRIRLYNTDTNNPTIILDDSLDLDFFIQWLGSTVG